MSKTGTCRWTHQTLEVWRTPSGAGLDYSHPHTRTQREEHVTLPENDYTCVWLSQFDLPPAIKRYHGTFELRDGDCDVCPHYVPAALHLLK